MKSWNDADISGLNHGMPFFVSFFLVSAARSLRDTHIPIFNPGITNNIFVVCLSIRNSSNSFISDYHGCLLYLCQLTTSTRNRLHRVHTFLQHPTPFFSFSMTSLVPNDIEICLLLLERSSTDYKTLAQWHVVSKPGISLTTLQPV